MLLIINRKLITDKGEEMKLKEDLLKIVKPEQICVDQEQLYNAASDRYNKFAKVYQKLTVPIPLAIVYPKDEHQVSEILKYCNQYKINVIARSGQTATEGGLENWKQQTIVVDASKMNKIINIDTYNMMATVEAGTRLQDLEDELRKLGYTTGHSPQSKPVAQYGGLVATRSIGQFSTLYGGIEDMVVGLECVFANGHIAKIKDIVRRAGGPDTRHIAIGNEGSLCYITKVTVKIFKYYENNLSFHGYLVDDLKSGIEILRRVITNGYRPSVARVYSEEDAAQHFYHFYEGKCVLLFMNEGPQGIVRATDEGVLEAAQHFKTQIIKEVDSNLIRHWFENLNWDQQKIDDEYQGMLDNYQHDGFTTEISATWENIPKIYDAVIKRVREEFEFADDLTMLGGHSSHSYINGTNMYFVYNYTINCEPEDEMLTYHHPIHTIIIEETLKLNGSMCHHHGIGKYRNEWTKDEHGSSYYMLETLKKAFDPNDIMNYGCIFPKPEGDLYQK